jgi:hypothetical protein
VIDQERPAPHESIASFQESEVRLRDLAAVLNRGEDLGIGPSPSCQRFGIDPIGLGSPGPTNSGGIGDDHFVSELIQETADPGRVGACLTDHASRGQRREVALEREFRGGKGGPFHDLPSGIEAAKRTLAIAQVQAYRDFRKGLLRLHGRPPVNEFLRLVSWATI